MVLQQNWIGQKSYHQKNSAAANLNSKESKIKMEKNHICTYIALSKSKERPCENRDSGSRHFAGVVRDIHIDELLNARAKPKASGSLGQRDFRRSQHLNGQISYNLM